MAVTFLTNEDGSKFLKSVNGVGPDENGNVNIEFPNLAEQVERAETAAGQAEYHATMARVEKQYAEEHRYLAADYAGISERAATRAEKAATRAEKAAANIPESDGTEDPTGYATEQWVKDQNYLTEVPEGYAKTEDIPQKAADIGALPDTYTPPNQTAEQVGADPKGTAAAAVSEHNTDTAAHNDLRLELKALADRLTAFFDSDDQTLDELSEIVAYITNNKTLIESITTSKVSVTDIVDDLVTNVANKPLSAAQGVVLKGLIDTLSNNLANYQPKGDYVLASEIATMKDTIKQEISEELVLGSTLKDSDNHFNKDTVLVGYEVYDGTGITAQSGSATSDYIPVTYGQTVYINNLPTYTTTDGKVRRLAVFDADKNYLGLVSPNISQTLTQYSCTVHYENAAFFVFSVYQRVTTSGLAETLDYTQVMVTFDEYRDYKEYVEPSEPAFEVSFSKPTKGKKMLIFGDSITETATMDDDGSNYIEGNRVNWMTFAKSMLETDNFKNYACSGATYKDNSSTEYRQSVSNQIALAVADAANDSAEIIVLSLGTNDGSANDDYSSAMAIETLDGLDRTKFYQAIRYAMWKLKTKYPNAKCFVATPIQRAAKEQDVSLRTAIIAMGNRYNFKVIDAEFESGIIRENEVTSGSGIDLSDGLHPNENGARKMAELYSSVILSAYSFDANC